MKETTSRDEKMKSRDADLNLSDDKINTIRKEFTFISEDLQRSDLIFRTKALIKLSFKRSKNSRQIQNFLSCC